jgi:TetR/AcrR family transcriptional regulator, transcriptional repressor of aconitase
MVITRLDSEERRKSIVDAALPLFARKGFAGTTTREIAEAAGVSEGLLFRHFPSKAALYQEIIRTGCVGDPAFEPLLALEASTGTLITMIDFMVRHFVFCARGSTDEMRIRMMLMSCLDDGDYARLAFETVIDWIYPKFASCLEAAERAGDLVPMPVAARNRFWFGHHVAAMLAYLRLPERPVLPEPEEPERLVAEAVWFLLRGHGLKDEVIATRYGPSVPVLQTSDPS